MQADYDSRADALSIDLIQFDRLEGQDSVDDTFCQVAFAHGKPANVELLNPASHHRYSLDGDALLAAAQAALAAPDRLVELKFSAVLAA